MKEDSGIRRWRIGMAYRERRGAWRQRRRMLIYGAVGLATYVLGRIAVYLIGSGP